MSQGLSWAIIDRHATGEKEGDFLKVSVDFVLLHDPLLALILPELRQLEKGIWDKEKVLVTVDHFAPPSTIERAGIVRNVLNYVRSEQIKNYLVYQGICHQLLVEGNWIGPGMIVLGTDSHTTTAGALGCLATGMGSTDILYALVTGKTWLRPPKAVRVDLDKAMPPYIMGKDVILDLLGVNGEAGFVYQSMEFYDNDMTVSMDDRFAICNMVVEGGAKNGLFFPDEITHAFMKQREGEYGDFWQAPDYNPDYDRTIALDLSRLNPKVALPSSPANVCDAAGAGDEEIDQVFIGSCTGGRLEDLRAASLILKGKRLAAGMRLLVSPASQAIYKKAIMHGYIQDIMDAGGIILNPSCGLCGGIDKGILAAGETCLSTSNRNFQGRMGDPASRVYLASALTAAATALTGRVIDPREVL
jgi:3-isopropylmalate/(R)-2-methylmalate dehydratase large subunit